MPDLGTGVNNNNNLTELIVKFSGDISGVADSLGGYAEILTCNYAVVTIPYENIDRLFEFKEIEYFELSKRVSRLLLLELNSASISYVQSEAAYGLSGKGVMVGIIDSGIDYTHEDFRNEDGTTRIVGIWDQTATDGNPPVGFRSGVEYSESQINEALESGTPYEFIPEVDLFSHGTAVAGVAAGNGRCSGGIEHGVAPQAAIAVVKIGNPENPRFSKTTEILKGIRYLIDKAREYDMPLSINISYGTSTGLHDGRSLFESCIDSMCDIWKTVISVATGNEGSASHHFFTILQKNKTESIEFSLSGNINGFNMTVLKNFSDEVNFELIAPNGDTTGVITERKRLESMKIGGVTVSAFYDLPTVINSNQQVFFLFETEESTFSSGIWVLRAICRDIVSGEINIWMPTVEEFGDETQFLRPTTDMTFTIPSTVLNVISVGGYNSFIGSFAEFSGCGKPTFKPDLVAPAVNIYSARAGGGYDTYTGTSMAAPFVTGSAALIMEWGIIEGNDPFLYGQKVKAFLTRGAERNLNIQYPNSRWGYGKLDLKSSMDIIDDNV
ncbi:MAG: S8 family serine peptidase [Clostridia bacterium]|nr:S8 family serine peptidase [Clostridia bacterium]MCI2000340.1 S8 family serine peptidase [Clostridia bacterium]MCI2015520.1 S8 family serine peptidase [Clostridia bacterium]